MLFYDSSLPVQATPIFDAAFFAQAAETDVIVRDAQGNPIRNADGSFRTAKGELRDLLVPFAGDRAAALAQAAVNQRAFVQQANDWVGALNRAEQEMTRVRPNGVDSHKTPKTQVNGQDLGNATISAETANTLAALKDSSGNSLLTKYFGVSGSPFAGPVTLAKMADGQSFAVFDNAFKSAVDSATQTAQLEQSSLQGLVSRQNNAIETMADLQKKFTATHDKLVGNLRPPQ